MKLFMFLSVYTQCIVLHRVPQIAILHVVNSYMVCILDTDDDRDDDRDDERDDRDDGDDGDDGDYGDNGDYGNAGDAGDDDSDVMMMLMMVMIIMMAMMVVIMMMMVMIEMRVTVVVEDFLWSPGTTTARSLIGRLEGRVDWSTIDKLAWLATSKKSFEFILHFPPTL